VMGLEEGVVPATGENILKALSQTGGDRSKAATLLGVHANHLSRLITTLDLRIPRS
jgi:hypothetical protein